MVSEIEKIEKNLLGLSLIAAVKFGFNIRVLHEDGMPVKQRDSCVVDPTRINVDVENGRIVKIWPMG